MIKLTRPECPNPRALENGDYKHPENKNALRIAAFDKCMYCESKISHIDFAHVEHIKPKSPDKYPELAYAWENLGYACPKCNNAKSDKYSEETPYVNPYAEQPTDFIFASGTLLFAKDGNERADLSISEIQLNRPELIEKRLNRILELEKTLKACYRTRNASLRENAIRELEMEASVDKEYSLIANTFLSSNRG